MKFECTKHSGRDHPDGCKWRPWGIFSRQAGATSTVLARLTPFTRGLGLSGVLQGAGGAGGLLAANRRYLVQKYAGACFLAPFQVMKILKFIQFAILLIFFIHHDAPASEAGGETSYAVFRIKKRHSTAKNGHDDIVNEIKSVAGKIKFDWSKVMLQSSGKGTKDLYIVIKADNPKELKKLKSELYLALKIHSPHYSVDIQDIEDLQPPNKKPPKSK